MSNELYWLYKYILKFRYKITRVDKRDTGYKLQISYPSILNHICDFVYLGKR